MKTEIENSMIRKVIDKSYSSGYNEAVRKAVEWLEKYADNYVWWFEGEGGVTDEFIDDFKKAMEK